MLLYCQRDQEMLPEEYSLTIDPNTEFKEKVKQYLERKNLRQNGQDQALVQEFLFHVQKDLLDKLD